MNMATWSSIELQRHTLIGSSDLAVHQPFDIHNWAARWQQRLGNTPAAAVVLHQTAVGILGEIPVEQIRDAVRLDSVLILDDEGMAASIRDLQPLIKTMLGIGMRPQQMLLWSDSGPQSGSLIPSAQSLTAFSNPQTNAAAAWSDRVTHHWVMLARVPRRHRLLAACDIIDRGLEHCGKMSCGSGGYQGYTYGPDEFQLVPQHLRDRFPIYLDGKISSSNSAMHTDSVQLPAVTDAVLHLVCESNWEDPDPVISDRWKIMQLTEKSSKPLLLGQLFLINGALGNVAALRELGFDCFDDIVDHSYDAEADPLLRVKMVVDQLETICSQSLAYWQRWRTDNQHRLLANRHKFLYLAANIQQVNAARLQKALADIDTRPICN